MQLEPYIFFYGRCEEALEFYKRVFGGDYRIQRFQDSPMGSDVPEDFRNKVMHASFTADGFTFMASDGRPGKTIDPEAGNISLSVSIEDGVQADRIFTALGEGGNVMVPLKDVEWGGRFGMLTDRFGNEWMISTP